MPETGEGPIKGVAVPVLLPVAIDQTYDYLVPQEIIVEAGSFVLVPFGPQTRIGVVWDKSIGGGSEKSIDPKKLKPLIDRLEVPPLADVCLPFVEWVARYTLSPLGMVLRMMMSASSAFEPPKLQKGLHLSKNTSSSLRLTPARLRAIEVSKDGLIRSKTELAKLSNCSVAVIDGLISSGVFIEVTRPPKTFPIPNPRHQPPTFSDSQAQAVEVVTAAVEAQNFSVTLLDGVTGSGKTEVYFEAVARCLEKEAQALIMLPEIALTSQFIDRFRLRFGVVPVEWHSGLSDFERGKIWTATSKGEVRVVVGARSALFLPFSHLGLIVVDEEHDASYKQDDRVHYQARDMSVVRARIGKFPIILASATPSLESHVNAQNGKYRHVILKSRYGGVALPQITPIDLRKEPPEKGRWLSPRLVAAVEDCLARGKQSLLFLNRRGYAPLTLCRKCGHRFECPQCTAWLVEHRFKNRVICHHCGFFMPIPDKCTQCGEVDALVACGPGVERVAEEVTERFPQSRIAILSSDVISSLSEMRAIIQKIEEGSIDIIIGTQIVAKGHNFPHLGLVGVVDGDLGLALGVDPRAGERTFQLLNQVTGRAGRTFGDGQGLIQTHLTEHPVMQAILSGDREEFLTREIEVRQRGALPPFGRLASIILSTRDKSRGEIYARDFVHHAPQSQSIKVLGPAEAPIFLVRGRYRWRLLVKASRETNIQSYIRTWLASAPEAGPDVRVTVDIDPYNFL